MPSEIRRDRSPAAVRPLHERAIRLVGLVRPEVHTRERSQEMEHARGRRRVVFALAIKSIQRFVVRRVERRAVGCG